jgi:hypothetical protein
MPDLVPQSGAPACVAADCLWESFAERGTAAFDAGQFVQSLTEWQAAAPLAETFDQADPRRATSRAALATIGYAAGLLAESAAELALREAAQVWQITNRWIDSMAIDLSGRSSSFHFRLERRHASAYRNLARGDYRRLAETGAAACAANLALVLHDRAPDEAARLYRHAILARKAGLGARDLGCLVAMENLRRLIRAVGDPQSEDASLSTEIEAAVMRDPLPPLTRWKNEKPARMTDRRRLLAAVYLSPVLIRH